MAIRINGDNTTAAPGITRGDDTDTGLQFGTDEVSIVTGGTEQVKVDSSGRLLVGTSSTSADTLFRVQGRQASASSHGVIQIARDQLNPTAGNGLGFLEFTDSAGSKGASIYATADDAWAAGDYPTRLVFATTADGASGPATKMEIKADGRLYVPGVYSFTASATNVVVQPNGLVARTSSSIKYKTNVETIQDQYSDAILNVRPVWYQSLSSLDNPEWGWWGFIAEEVAEIDPRLVHWKTTEPIAQEDGSVEHVSCVPEPEDVAYERFVPHLLNLIKRQKEQIETLETRLTALEGGAS